MKSASASRLLLRVVSLFLALTVVFLAVACSKPAPSTSATPQAPAAAKPPAAPKVYNFRLAAMNPPGSSLAEMTEVWYARRVKELSNGQINIENFLGAQLGKGQEHLEMVRTKAVEMGTIAVLYYGGQMPLYDFDQMPGIVEKSAQRLALYRYMTENSPPLKAYWEQFNQVPIYYASTPEINLNTRKPARTPADFKGLKMRAGGGGQKFLVESLGANMVAIGPGETYTALQQGTVDGAVVHTALMYSMKWHEVCKYTIRMTRPISGTTWLVTMNRDVYNGLPQNLKDIMRQASIEHEKYLAKAVLDDADDNAKKMEAEGSTITRLNQAETDAFWKATEGSLNKWMAAYPEAAQVVKMANEWLAAHPAKDYQY